MRVVFTGQSKDDLREIGAHIDQDSPLDAIRFVDKLVDACLELSDFPRRFPAEPRYGPNAHRRLFGNYLIIYDVLDDRVEILTIVHTARNLDALRD